MTYKLIDIKTGQTLKRSKHIANLIEFIDKLTASGKYDARQLKVIK